MSNPMIRSNPAIPAVRAAPTIPPAGAGQDRVLALEVLRRVRPAIGLHEIQPGAGQFGRDLVDVAAQHRRQIGVDHGGVAPRHQAQQRTDRVTGGDLRETSLAGQIGQPALLLWVFPGVHQHDGAGVDTVLSRLGEDRAGVGSSSGSISLPSTPTRPSISSTRSYSIVGRVIAKSNKRGRA